MSSTQGVKKQKEKPTTDKKDEAVASFAARGGVNGLRVVQVGHVLGAALGSPDGVASFVGLVSWFLLEWLAETIIAAALLSCRVTFPFVRARGFAQLSAQTAQSAEFK